MPSSISSDRLPAAAWPIPPVSTAPPLIDRVLLPEPPKKTLPIIVPALSARFSEPVMFADATETLPKIIEPLIDGVIETLALAFWVTVTLPLVLPRYIAMMSLFAETTVWPSTIGVMLPPIRPVLVTLPSEPDWSLMAITWPSVPPWARKLIPVGMPVIVAVIAPLLLSELTLPPDWMVIAATVTGTALPVRLVSWTEVLPLVTSESEVMVADTTPLLVRPVWLASPSVAPEPMMMALASPLPVPLILETPATWTAPVMLTPLAMLTLAYASCEATPLLVISKGLLPPICMAVTPTSP